MKINLQLKGFYFLNLFRLIFEKLRSLGFSKEKASSAYYASGKNENYAANILLFNQNNNEGF